MAKDDKTLRITILRNGPIHIQGVFEFKDSSGNSTRECKDLLLCRCGASGNMPFCDETHCKVGIKD